MTKTCAISLALLVLTAGLAQAQTSPYTPSHGPGAADSGSPLRAQPLWGGNEAEAPAPSPGGPPAPARLWGSVDYLLWWTKQGRLPPLVTASAPGAGAIVGPDTVVLFGGSHLDNEERSGARFLLGGWLDEARTLGVEFGYFFLGSRSVNFAASGDGSPGTPALGRPFFNAITNTEDSQLVAFPGRLAGRVLVTASTRLQGWEGNALCNLYCSPCARVDALFGFRFLELNEGLGIHEDLSVLPGVPVLGGTAFGIQDQFDTRNRFYGGQVGARGEYRWGNLSLSGWAKVALGDSQEVVHINGTTLILPPGAATPVGPLSGGLLALPTNIGHHRRDEFAVVPEVNISVGYWLTHYLRATVGYTFLYYSSVARPGDQVNRTVNPTLLPTSTPAAGPTGPAQPGFTFRDTDFWAQGFNFGLEFRY
jgi:hypothetical protein